MVDDEFDHCDQDENYMHVGSSESPRDAEGQLEDEIANICNIC
jgi:hypothetical protein